MKYTPLNKFVRLKRKSLKMTQKEMSEKSGVGIRFVRELEKGKQTLKMDKINQVLNLFGFVLGPMEAIRDNGGNEES
jgi:y4mF family transcriptional regulator